MNAPAKPKTDAAGWTVTPGRMERGEWVAVRAMHEGGSFWGITRGRTHHGFARNRDDVRAYVAAFEAGHPFTLLY